MAVNGNSARDSALQLMQHKMEQLDTYIGLQVRLRRDEMLYACMVGCSRGIDDLVGGAHAAHGASNDQAWQYDVQGALGEFVVAKHYGVFWSGALGNKQAKDVGGAQVRSTPISDGSLIVHKTDPDDDPFVLVCGLGPVFWIRGWLLGHEAKQDYYWRTHGVRQAAFFVPPSELRSVDTLELPWRA